MKKFYLFSLLLLLMSFNGASAYNDNSDDVSKLLTLAKQGDAASQNKLGDCYYDGKGVAQDYSQAVNWYRKAAEQGYATAQCNLGWCYKYGKGVSQDYNQAVNWYRKAAEQGNARAQNYLGVCYENGQGVSQDYAQAVNWYRKAAEQGYADAQANLGVCYEFGQLVSQDYAQAVNWYRKAAEQGNAIAQNNLGRCYEIGKGVTQDDAQAVNWYRKAAEQGEANAQYNLGVCYKYGKGVSQDYNQAVNCYRKAAEQGNARAQNNLGVCYENGQGVSQDYTQAVNWYRKAAEQGHAAAQYNLGLCYENGKGVSQDDAQAVNWYSKAAEQGDAEAQANLEKLSTKINQNSLAQNTQVTNPPTTPTTTPKPATTPVADVDQNLPTTDKKQERTFALIIANEHYEMAEPVAYALNDGKVFADYCEQTLGLPKHNIRFYEDATFGKMKAAMRDIKEIADAYEGDMQLIVYYAGHGVPNEQNKEAYLLPVDVDGRHTEEDCYPLSKFYKELGELKSKNVTVFLDACFSGAQRGEGMLASVRGVAIKPKDNAPQGKMVVFSAATGDETASPYNEKGHGLFTYFLLKKLRDTKGDCTLGELGEYVQKSVRQQSVVINRKSQTPTVVPSPSLTDSWQTLKLK